MPILPDAIENLGFSLLPDGPCRSGDYLCFTGPARGDAV